MEAKDPDHVAAEAADVIYFMMTRCVAAGVGMREIEQHLDRRSMKVCKLSQPPPPHNSSAAVSFLLLFLYLSVLLLTNTMQKITRRPGNAKDWRSKAAEQVVKQKCYRLILIIV